MLIKKMYEASRLKKIIKIKANDVINKLNIIIAFNILDF